MEEERERERLRMVLGVTVKRKKIKCWRAKKENRLEVLKEMKVIYCEG